jgi:hypothetical protein
VLLPASLFCFCNVHLFATSFNFNFFIVERLRPLQRAQSRQHTRNKPQPIARSATWCHSLDAPSIRAQTRWILTTDVRQTTAGLPESPPPIAPTATAAFQTTKVASALDDAALLILEQQRRLVRAWLSLNVILPPHKEDLYATILAVFVAPRARQVKSSQVTAQGRLSWRRWKTHITRNASSTFPPPTRNTPSQRNSRTIPSISRETVAAGAETTLFVRSSSPSQNRQHKNRSATTDGHSDEGETQDHICRGPPHHPPNPNKQLETGKFLKAGTFLEIAERFSTRPAGWKLSSERY